MSQNYSRLLSQGDASSTTSMIKGAVIGKIVGILVLVSFIALLVWLVTKLFQKFFPQLKEASKEVGQDCLESFECIGYKVGDGPACCGTVGSKTCTLKVKDTFGAWWCPNEAKTTGGTKIVGQECNESSECAGYTFGSGVSGTACCLDKIDNKKKCADKVKDNAGSWWCPSEATGQKALGSPCDDSYQCAGYKAGSGPACCGLVGKKTCTNKQKDWAGNWYCPLECVGAFAGKPATCK